MRIESREHGLSDRSVRTWRGSITRWGTRALLTATLAALVAMTVRAQPEWAIIDLGTLGGVNSSAIGTSDAGHVVGWSSMPDGTARAFLWTASAGMMDLGTIGGSPLSSSFAESVNKAGHVVGWGYVPGATRAFLWTPSEGMMDLGTLGGASSAAYDIDDQGRVVGWSDTASNERHAFLWTAANGMIDLGSLGSDTSEARAINEAGVIVGRTMVFDQPFPGSRMWHAFRWTAAGGMVDLGPTPFHVSQANDVNESDHIVGWTYALGFDGELATRWPGTGGWFTLGTFGGFASQAHGINDAGHVVGRAGIFIDYPRNPFEFDRAFVWTGGLIAQLGTLGGFGAGWRSAAHDINNRGLIVGESTTAERATHAVVWCQPRPPEITSAAANPSMLWPPDHHMVTVRIDYAVTTSGCSATSAGTTWLSVVSDEPDNGVGDGNFPNDAVVVDNHTVQLRAERSGRGEGRTYTVRIHAIAGAGLESTQDVTVRVPKSLTVGRK